MRFLPITYPKACFPTDSTTENVFKLQNQLEHIREAKIKLELS